MPIADSAWMVGNQESDNRLYFRLARDASAVGNGKQRKARSTLAAPVPFGGREGELQSLDGWLANHTAAPYTLIAEKAGIGKSALLVHWAQSLLDRM
jgi:hypothetical protein